MIVYTNEQDYVNRSQRSAEISFANDIYFHHEMVRHGKLLTAEQLYPSATATTLRNRASEVVTNDGPFADTGNQISRIYIYESPNLDEALQIATWILAIHSGAVEVRPLMEALSKGNINGSEK
jgi:hypothetical protein